MTVTTYDQVPQINRSPGMVARVPSGATAATGLTGKEILRTIRKRMWMIILSVVIAAILAAVTTIVWGTYAPFYTAEGFLKVNPPQSPLALNYGSVITREVMDRYTATNARMVRSEQVFNKALQMENLTKTAWFAEDPTTAVQRLLREIDVAPVANTDLIRVSMTGKKPEEIANIVNGVMDAAVDDNRITYGRTLQDRIKNLQKEKETKLSELAQVRNQMTVARPRDIPIIEEQRNSLNIQLKNVLDDINKLEQDQSEAKNRLESLRSSDIRNNLDLMNRLESDPTLSSLRAAKVNLETRRDNLVRKYGRNHRQVQDCETQLASMASQVEAREKDLLEKLVRTLQDAYEQSLNNFTAKLLTRKSDLEAIKASTRGLERNLAELKNLEETEKNLNQRIQKIDDGLMELGLQFNSEAQIDKLRIAIAPKIPTMPTWGIMMPLGIILGLMVGLGTAFLLEFMDTSIKSSADVTRRVDLPVLGMIPHSDDLEEEVEDLRLTLMTNPNSLMGEAFRQIRTCLQFSGPANTRRSLLVTSALPEDGRTMVSMNLAAAIASGGRKVLVIDANFRQSAIRQLFPQCKDAGLSNLLVGQGQWRDLVCEVGNNLSVMASGPLPPNPAELLGSEQMRTLLAELCEAYDQVIFDGAPSLVVSDSPILATQVDGVILVVRAGANTYGIVQRTRDMLNRVGAHVLGVALNGVRATAGGYLRKSYETFYEYHEQPQLPSQK